MIAAETGAASVADPLGGSWLVERLTDELEAQARDYLARIDERGGMVAAVEAGFPQAEIAEASYAYQRAFERGERAMVGVNAHVEPDEEEPEIHRADPEAERLQIERVRAWRGERDAGRHARALAAVAAACEGTDNVMPALVAAADAGATIGEMCDVFRAVWGRYRDPAQW
jgi:methylmalonyl-CoA mutase N-terminal domain/subunit